jgi:hypothetical protein
MMGLIDLSSVFYCLFLICAFKITLLRSLLNSAVFLFLLTYRLYEAHQRLLILLEKRHRRETLVVNNFR